MRGEHVCLVLMVGEKRGGLDGQRALTLVNGSLGRKANDQVMWDVMCAWGCVGVLVVCI